MKLIIAEKPSVAKEIAKVVGAAKSEKGYLSGDTYFVTWCVGHLVSLAKPEAYGEKYSKWDLDTLPIIPTNYITEVSANTLEQYNIIKSLMHRSDVTELIAATDAGREGELIFRLVYNEAGCTKPFKRLWISSMEEKSIKDGLSSMRDGTEYDNLYYAALCRQRADWLVGINLTRLYSRMYNQKLSCGRVQTPTINLIVQRQRDIDGFVPQTYYVISADCIDFTATCRTDTKDAAEAIIEKCLNKEALVKSVEKTEKKDNPAALYDLTTLQRDANRMLGYSAQQTLDSLQKLYDNKLATYPRTDSRYITADQEESTKELIDTLLQTEIFSDLVLNNYSTKNANMSQIINDKKVTDHHAVLPTACVTKDKIAALPTSEKNILLLISYRLLSAVYSPHIYAASKIVLEIENENFTATGREEISSGYQMIEQQLKQAIKSNEENEETELKEASNETLPALDEGTTIKVENLSYEEKKTKPPISYTEDTLLSAMETAGKSLSDLALKEAMKGNGLGTPATRASIIENIIHTGYIERSGKKLLPTPKAYTFIDLVTDKIKEPALTAEWEQELANIESGKSAANDFMNNITDFIRSFVCDTKASYAPENCSGVFRSERESIGSCPKCGKMVVEMQKSFSCESGKGGCGFVIWKTISGKSISKSQATKIITKGKSDLIKGFISRAGKPFDAYLIMKPDNTIGFSFS